MKSLGQRGAGVDRRSFIAGAAGALILGTAAEAAVAADNRYLRLFRYHSGERLFAHYYAGGRYRDPTLMRINKLCRDLRQKEQGAMDVHLIDYVHTVVAALAPGSIVEIVSAFRSEATNEWLRSKSKNVAKRSLHMEGRAMDIRVRGFTAEQVAETARGLKIGGVGLYSEANFVHLDTGQPRFWAR